MSNEVLTNQEAIPGMGSLGGSTLRLNDFNTTVNLAIVSVLFGNPQTDTHTGKNYTNNPQHIGVQKNWYRTPHMHRRQHQENTIRD
jgi:hypothetical protein